MRIRLERDVAIAIDALEAWWNDLREGPNDHAFLGTRAGFGRRLSKIDERTTRVEDTGRFFGLPLLERYEVTRLPGSVTLEGGNNFSLFRATYAFEARGETTRVSLDADVVPIGLLALFDFIGRPIVRRFLARDLDGHLADAARDLQPGGASSP